MKHFISIKLFSTHVEIFVHLLLVIYGDLLMAYPWKLSTLNIIVEIQQQFKAKFYATVVVNLHKNVFKSQSGKAHYLKKLLRQ